MNSVSVSLEDRLYSINIGSGLLQQLGSMVQSTVPASKYFFVLDESIEATHGQVAIQSFTEESDACTMQALEMNKSIDSVEEIWSAMLSYGCDRTVPLIAIGGGLVGDVGIGGAQLRAGHHVESR